MIIKKHEDVSVGDGIFYLDGKRFYGGEAQEYLVDSCHFTDAEAIQYLVMLVRDYGAR